MGEGYERRGNIGESPFGLQDIQMVFQLSVDEVEIDLYIDQFSSELVIGCPLFHFSVGPIAAYRLTVKNSFQSNDDGIYLFTRYNGRFLVSLNILPRYSPIIPKKIS